MALKRLTLTRGDSQTYTFTFKQKDGTVYNLKNWTIFFTLKTNYSLPDDQASLQIINAITINTPTGIATITLTPENTTNLDPGEYDFDIAVITAAGESYTVLKGKLDLEYDVTRTKGTAGTAA